MTNNDAIAMIRNLYHDALIGDYRMALGMAIKALEKCERWIPVEQDLPEDGVTVWVTIKGHDVIRCEDGETLEQAIARISKIRWVTQGYWSDEEHGWNDPSFGCPLMVQPIAWMPIDTPEPWQGGQE